MLQRRAPCCTSKHAQLLALLHTPHVNQFCPEIHVIPIEEFVYFWIPLLPVSASASTCAMALAALSSQGPLAACSACCVPLLGGVAPAGCQNFWVFCLSGWISTGSTQSAWSACLRSAARRQLPCFPAWPYLPSEALLLPLSAVTSSALSENRMLLTSS